MLCICQISSCSSLKICPGDMKVQAVALAVLCLAQIAGSIKSDCIKAPVYNEMAFPSGEIHDSISVAFADQPNMDTADICDILARVLDTDFGCS